MRLLHEGINAHNNILEHEVLRRDGALADQDVITILWQRASEHYRSNRDRHRCLHELVHSSL